jgi:hypothetical protein
VRHLVALACERLCEQIRWCTLCAQGYYSGKANRGTHAYIFISNISCGILVLCTHILSGLLGALGCDICVRHGDCGAWWGCWEVLEGVDDGCERRRRMRLWSKSAIDEIGRRMQSRKGRSCDTGAKCQTGSPSHASSLNTIRHS